MYKFIKTASLSKKLIAIIAVLNILLFFFFLITHHYPSYLMFIHLGSIISLWLILAYKIHFFEIFRINYKEVLIIFGLIAIALFIRLDRIDQLSPGVWGDEIAVGIYSQTFINQNEIPPFIINHPYSTPVTYAIGRSIQIFGHSLFALKLPIAIIGAFTVGAFYILLRLYFPIFIALLGSILMIFQYTQITLSRLAYEPIPSLFFQILTAIFLTLYYKTRNIYYLLGISLSLVGGLYTYLNFRPFAVFIVFITVYIIFKHNKHAYLNKVLLFLCALFIIGNALISFQILYPQALWGRASDISIFSQHYTQPEFIKEFLGNVERTGTFAITGDPNPEHNPANVPPFDILTIVLAIIGIIYLWFKEKSIFLISLILMLPPFISDIFSVERISEFHYYGLGHPHALRISGWIFVILFAATFGLWALYSKGKKNYPKEINLSLWFVVAIISILNWYLYFNQLEVNPRNYYWNYYYHNAASQELINNINKSNLKTVAISKDLLDKDLLGYQFFVNPQVKLISFQSSASGEILSIINNNDIVAVGVTQNNLPILSQIASSFNTGSVNYSTNIISDPAFYVNHIYYFTRLPY